MPGDMDLIYDMVKQTKYMSSRMETDPRYGKMDLFSICHGDWQNI